MNEFQREKIRQRLYFKEIMDDTPSIIKHCCKFCDDGFSEENVLRHEDQCKLKYWPKYACYSCEALFKYEKDRCRHEHEIHY